MNFNNTHKPSSSATLTFPKILGTVPCYFKLFLNNTTGSTYSEAIAFLDRAYFQSEGPILKRI